MNSFDKYVNETKTMLFEKSINKIQKEFQEVVTKMAELAQTYTATQGDEKAEILQTLKELTADKRRLAAELDAKVAGKDRNVQLVITEAKNESRLMKLDMTLNKKQTEKIAQQVADEWTKEDSKKDGLKFNVTPGTEPHSFDLDIEDKEGVDPRATGEFAGGSYYIRKEGDVLVIRNAATGGWSVATTDLKGKNFKLIPAKDSTNKRLDESSVTERHVTLKRRYTENHPAKTAGKFAKVRNKVLEAIADGTITQEEFDSIVSELSNNSKRWSKNNSKYFTVSEDGISLSKFGKKILAGITVNEKTEKNPGIWVPGGFDKDISKVKNSKITRDLVAKTAKKHEVDLDDAIKYVEFGWAIDLNENKTMKTQFIYESFSEFVNSLNESTVNENDAKVIVNAFADYYKKRDEVGADDWEQFIYNWTVMGDGGDELESSEIEWDTVDDVLTMLDKKGYKKIDHEGIIELYENALNEAFASTKLASILTGGNKMSKDLPKAFYNMAKIALDKVQDVDIIEIDPQTARKEKRNNAVYIYLTTNEKENPYAARSSYGVSTIPANTLLAITDGSNEWMNTQWQSRYNRKNTKKTLSKTKRDDSSGFAKSGTNDSYGSGISSLTKVAELADRAYCLDLDVLKARYSTQDIIDKRTEAKSGAIAFKDDKEFKQQNLNRYETILANKASKLPIDKIVKDAIDKMSEQIKDALVKGEKGRYGDIIVGTSDKGREAKLRDAASHMQNILDDYQRYVSYVKQAEEEEKAGYGSNYYQREVKSYAKNVTDKVKQIEGFSYAW